MVFADNQEGGPAMSHYRHLSIEEREKLYLMHGQGKSFREIRPLTLSFAVCVLLLWGITVFTAFFN